jgi:hypothetical protein
VTTASVRVLVHWVERLQEITEPNEAQFDRVTVPALREGGMLEDVLMLLARCGASAVKVGVTLQIASASVRRLDQPVFNQATQHLSRSATKRAAHVGLLDAAVQQLRDAATDAQWPPVRV